MTTYISTIEGISTLLPIMIIILGIITVWKTHNTKKNKSLTSQSTCTSPSSSSPPSLTSEVESVNYHFHRECNYACAFCFHTAKNKDIETLPNIQRGLQQLKQAGMKKLNFSGGEPFLHPQLLGEMCKYSKTQLKLESVSIVSNGSKITKRWLERYGRYVDMIAISCDSFNEETNIKIGRGKGDHLSQLQKISQWCQEYQIWFKINTTITSLNYMEDMVDAITLLNPKRWKVFQVLIVIGENDGAASAKRDAKHLTVTTEEFYSFIHRHRECHPVDEDNSKMRASYIILDEKMRFLDCSSGGKIPSSSILDVGVENALKEIRFDGENFIARGGKYEWSRIDVNGGNNSALHDPSVITDIEDL